MSVSVGRKVAIALSGGVDSAVAAALLQRQGFNLQGVHLRLSPLAAPPDRVEALAHYLGIPLTVLDLQGEFAREVLDYFVSEYARGRTPNPCVRCNAAIKFGYLWEYLKKSGVTHLATGHYARRNLDDPDAPGLFRGVDRRKDQSYFLSHLPLSLLPNLLFPLGQMTKQEVWRLSRQAGLPVRENQPESMELCFIPTGDYQDFLQARRGFCGPPGDFVDSGGRLLGRHRGVENYTVGQRRGLGIPAREPFYVIDIQPETNRVVLGHREELLSPGLTASGMNWLITPPAGAIEAAAVIRYRHPGVRARITPRGDGSVQVAFATPQSAVAPGQAVVFFDGDRVLGGGWIEARMK
jgi:tRNA-specific 2-thiouridylase